ncbi:glycosyl hydrolase family protein [Bacillus sp. FJAT-42376]|uniref:carbohydrate binding domain-containing protein n=1 Tax=Bacillus sp. FJAT-42376 TaxID=2014076 RepID=UPI000F4F65A7|nr:family 16 glycosylhydrolase [Bacillus sp. FJAT-42376]AZB41113.1 glycosyl hydrolase family protein [Bacillus sp. FJAT-42376]
MRKLTGMMISCMLIAGVTGPAQAAGSKEKIPFHPVAIKGEDHGTAKLIIPVPKTHHVAVKVSKEPFGKVKTGDLAPKGRTVTNPYRSGTDLTGVDPKINRYAGVYLLDAENHVLDFEQITLKENQIKKETWNLIWQDEFDGTSINESKWNFIQGGGGYGNNELQNYTNRTQNARLENGSLVIEAHKEALGGNDYTSAKLTTQNKGDWTYGRYEIRAKLPKGQGMWPAIWMMPTDYDLYSGWPASGEIDIMELLGHAPNEVYGTLHYGLPWKNTGEMYRLPNGTKDFSEAYHTFSIDWEPGEIRWYVDGVLYARQNDWYSKNENAAAPYTYPAPFDRDFYLQLNLAVGGNWPGYPDSTTVFPSRMLVDYVRVYELDGKYREAGERPIAEEAAADLRPPLADGNYVYNGEFEAGLSEWKFQPFEPSTLFGGEGTAESVNGEAKISITKPGYAVHAIQFVQPNLPIEKGERYKLTFDARSTGPRAAGINISGPERSYTRYLSDQTLSLTDTMQSFSYEFTMESETDPHARLEFNMGQGSDLPVWIDHVKLVKLPQDPNAPKKVLPNGNYIYNGTFDQGTGRMEFWNLSVDRGSKAEASVGEAIPERKLHVDIQRTGSYSDAIRLSQNKLNLEKDAAYILTFDAKADAKRNIGFHVTNETRSAFYTKTEQIPLTADMKSYRVLIQPSESNPNSVIEFLLGGNRTGVTIDNIEMKRLAKPVTINPMNSRIEAENYQDMFGVQNGATSVGWIDEGDWMQYAVDVKEAGEYRIAFLAASGRDGGKFTLLSKAGNQFTGDLPKGEIKPEQADARAEANIPQTGGWDTWKTFETSIRLEKGIQTLQVYAPNANLDWMEFRKVGE